MGNKFKLGEIVRIKVDPDSMQYMITGFLKRKRVTMYECSSATEVQFKFDYEIELQEPVKTKKVTGFKS